MAIHSDEYRKFVASLRVDITHSAGYNFSMSKKLTAIILILLLSVALASCKPNETKSYVTVTFVTGCDIVIEPITIDGKEEKYMPEDPMRAGYEFAGWYYDQLFMNPFSTSDAITMDITLYAKWIKKGSTTPDDRPDIEDDKGIKYNYDSENGYYIVTGYAGDAESIVVPARYNATPVMKIAANAFSGTSLKSVTLGENIINIGDYAFRNCLSLTKITVADGNAYYKTKDGILYNKEITTLMVVPCAFENDTLKLSGVTQILPYAFENCSVSVAFTDDKYPIIESFAFAGIKGDVTVAECVTEIRKDAFNGATGKVLFAAGNTISALRNGSFDNYHGETLVVPGTVNTIEWQAFYDCTATVILTNTFLTSIGERAFAGYRGKTLVIPASVTEIGKNAFYWARTEITFAEGSLYETVGEQAFASFGGSEVKGEYGGKVTFPDSVKTVKKNAFYGSYSYVYFLCKKEEITFESGAMSMFKGKANYLG